MTRYTRAALFAIAMLLVGTEGARGQASIVTGLTGYCIEVTPGSTDPARSMLRTRKCDGGDYQKFWYNRSTKELQAQGRRCVGVWGNQQNNDRLTVAPCNGNKDQKWRFDGHQIKGVYNNRCWDVRNGSLLEYGEMQIWDCHWGYNQEFGAFNTNRVVSYPPLSAGDILSKMVKAVTSGGSASFTMPIGNNLQGAAFPLNGAAPLANVTPLAGG
jgi:hypothetical protein